jgi:hypothetical protein
MAAEDYGLVRLLEAFLGETRGQSAGQRVVTRTYRLDPKTVEPFLAPDAVIERVRDLTERTDLSERELAAVEAFVRGYELRSRGEDPNW